MKQIVSLPDGRELCLEVAGADDGEVVLVHNGTPNSRLLSAPHVADAEARGIRLVGYDRPGYGGSTRQLGRSVADAAEDARAIAAGLGVDKMLTWGISGGGPHALACAALAPDLIVAAASLASLAPHGASGLDYFSGMGELNVEDFQLCLDDAPAYERKAAVDCDEMLLATPDGLLKQWESLLSELDAAAATKELAQYLVEVVQSGLGPGPGGYIDDMFAFVRPWGFELGQIEIPVLLWQGAQDRFVPFGHGQWLASQIPGVEAHLSDSEGHLTLQSRIGEVHQWLLTKLRQN